MHGYKYVTNEHKDIFPQNHGYSFRASREFKINLDIWGLWKHYTYLNLGCIFHIFLKPSKMSFFLYLINIVANFELEPGVLHGNPGLHVLILLVLRGDLLHQLGVHLVRSLMILLPRKGKVLDQKLKQQR